MWPVRLDDWPKRQHEQTIRPFGGLVAPCAGRMQLTWLRVMLSERACAHVSDEARPRSIVRYSPREVARASNHELNEMLSQLVAGAISGFVNTVLLNPLDVIKTRYV